jgi:uncharacterized protein
MKATLVSTLLMVVLSFSALAQLSYVDSVQIQRDTINQHFSDTSTSILMEEDLMQFEGLSFYEVNDTFKLPATFRKKIFKRKFEMVTSTTRKPIYRKYGILKFWLDGKEHRLVIYQNVALSKSKKYHDYLFCPFKDLTNTDGSYGGGRYLDFRIGDLKENPVIDFNFCYNPYCAYNYKYSCPIPPKENHLKVRIEAGVKAFKKLSDH